MARAPGALRQRVITALVLAAGLLTLLFVLPASILWIVGLVILAGAWEWSAFLNEERREVRFAFVVLVALGLALGWQWSAQLEGFALLLTLSGVWWLIALGWIVFAPQRGGPVSAAVAGFCALVPSGVALARLSEFGTTPREGAVWLLFSLVVVMAADTAAYFIGHRFGRTKLAPQVSPGKTWEGVIGGVCASAAIAVIAALWLHWPFASLVLIAVGASAFSVVGDLTESLMKRHAGLKDSGRLFPGHGGVLDRLDSLTAGIPLFVLGLLKSGLLVGIA